MSEEKVETVEIEEPVKAEEVKLPTREELKAGGFSAQELYLAEKHGKVAAEPKDGAASGKPEEKADEVKPVEKDAPIPSEKKPNEVEQVPNRGALPDFEIKDPAKEKVFLDTFGPGTPQRAMYFRMKNERQSRQRAEMALGEERKARAALEARLSALESGKVAETDENGNAVDPEEKPLTIRALREMEKQRADEAQRAEQEHRDKVASVTSAQKDQEEYARSAFPDFDDTAKKAADVIQNLETLVPEKWKQDKIVRMVKDLQVAAANASAYEIDGYNAAFIAYEIGKMHPDFSGNGHEPTKREPLTDPKANGSLNPGNAMKRIEENTQRRASSASIPGSGGRRTISADDVGLEDLNRMTTAERLRFREKHPERYTKLLRG